MKPRTEDLPKYIKTVEDIIEEIKKLYPLDSRVTYFKIDVKCEFSKSSTSYNEREVNKKLNNPT